MEPVHLKERRRSPRFELPETHVRCVKEVALSFLTKRLTVTLRNISATGLSLFIEEEIRPGRRIKGTIDIPIMKDMLRFSAEALWVRPIQGQYRGMPPRYVVGLEFTGLTVADQVKIEAMRKWFTSSQFKKTQRFLRSSSVRSSRAV